MTAPQPAPAPSTGTARCGMCGRTVPAQRIPVGEPAANRFVIVVFCPHCDLDHPRPGGHR